ncbi:MAG: SDR family NAD(P)-dependent oxidoreductase [Dehalococcoidales bacterium]|jgi:3-oxoacyl-[acyl-carrier protein] reductase
MDLGLQGKVAMVTGAGSQTGFGKGIALALAGEGCNVVIVDKDLEGAQKTAASIEALGREALALIADVTSSAEVGAAVKQTVGRFGGIDILVNNAGAATPPRPFAEKTEAEWEPDINLNLKAVFICTKAVLPQMIERQHGKIINISSGVGTMGLANSSIYSAAKAGVMAFTKSLAKEVIGKGINVNSISPGIGDTGFLRSSQVLKTAETPPEFARHVSMDIPAGRMTTPQDIGSMAAFLASDVSSDIVGQVIDVDGGKIIKF